MRKAVRFILFMGLFSIVAHSCQKEEKTSVFFDEISVAEVNGEKISLTEFNNHMRNFMYALPGHENISAELMQTLYKSQINEMVDHRILLQEAQKRNINAEDDNFQIFLNSISAGYTPEEFTIQLKEVNLDNEEWKKLNRERYIISRLVDAEVYQHLKVSDDDVSEYISNNPEIIFAERQYEVQQILVQSPELAQLVLKDLKNGASFTEYVDKYSISADKINEGNMGFITRDLLPAELNKPIFALKKIGQLSPIIKTGMGYHIFKLLSIKKKTKFTNKDLKGKIINIIKRQRLNDAYKIWIENLRKNSTVKVDLNTINNDSKY